MKFREHRGSLDNSMETVVEFNTRAELFCILKKITSVDPTDFKVEPYGGFDERIGWDTHIVSLEGYGVFGFTNSPVD